MSTFKEKSQIFILGMMAGLIIAGGFFVLKLDDYFKELNLYKNVVKTFYLRSKSSETNVKPDNSELSEETKSMNVNFKKRNNSDKNSTKTAYLKRDQLSDSDSLTNKFVKDSISSNSDDSEKIIVRKDELLTYKILEVINLSPLASVNNSDSLIQKVSGIRDDRNNSKQFYNVELWQSPLNYKGYKLSNYKMVLYGIASAEGLKIFKLDNEIYLKSMSTIYKLEQSIDFRPYQIVADPAIINKLK